MKIELDITLHLDGDMLLNRRLDELLHLYHLIKSQGVHMSAQIEALKTAVTAESTAVDSAIVLLNGLSARIAELKDDPVALQALADEVNAKSAALSDAVVANTPTA